MQSSVSSSSPPRGLANRNSSRVMLLPMQHGKALPPAINEFIRRELLAWLAADPTRRQAHLAARLNVSPAHMTNVLKNGRGGGYAFEADVAAFLGIGVEELRRRAAAEAQTAEPVRVTEDRYANRALAVEFMRPWATNEAIRQVQSISLQSPTDPPPKWWADQIEAADRLVRMDLRDPARIAARDERAEREGDELAEVTRPKQRRR